jgi:hypothetical protein
MFPCLFLCSNPAGHLFQSRNQKSQKEIPVLPGWQVIREDLVLPEFSSRRTRRLPVREEQSFNVRQSAKQLDVQKNILLNGFDSSTENNTFFELPVQKIKLHHSL